MNQISLKKNKSYETWALIKLLSDRFIQQCWKNFLNSDWRKKPTGKINNVINKSFCNRYFNDNYLFTVMYRELVSLTVATIKSSSLYDYRINKLCQNKLCLVSNHSLQIILEETFVFYQASVLLSNLKCPLDDKFYCYRIASDCSKDLD